MAISRDLDSGFNYSHRWGFHPLSVVVLVFLYVVKVCNIRCKGVQFLYVVKVCTCGKNG